MLVELTLLPLGEAHTAAALAEALELIAESGLPYRLGASATCIEGDWDEVMAVVHACHRLMARRSPHLVTLLKIEEDGGERSMLERNVAAIAERADPPGAIANADDFPGIHV